jgi:hypothetical protein
MTFGGMDSFQGWLGAGGTRQKLDRTSELG